DDPAEVVAHKTKKGRKRIRAKALSNSRKKSKTSSLVDHIFPQLQKITKLIPIKAKLIQKKGP
ncbi:4366_t:CDS:1, partial [Dentiscutata erythropus]